MPASPASLWGQPPGMGSSGPPWAPRAPQPLQADPRTCRTSRRLARMSGFRLKAKLNFKSFPLLSYSNVTIRLRRRGFCICSRGNRRANGSQPSSRSQRPHSRASQFLAWHMGAGSRFHRAFPTKSESGVSPPSCGDAGPAGAGPLPHFPVLLPQQPPPDSMPGLGLRRVRFLGGHTSVPENGLCLLWSGLPRTCVLQTATHLWQRHSMSPALLVGSPRAEPQAHTQATSPRDACCCLSS